MTARHGVEKSQDSSILHRQNGGIQKLGLLVGDPLSKDCNTWGSFHRIVALTIRGEGLGVKVSGVKGLRVWGLGVAVR